MITKDQYEFFKAEHNREAVRYSELIKKGQIYLSVQSFIMTALLFKLKDLINAIERVNCLELARGLSVGSIIIIIISMLFNVWAMKISKYDRVSNLKKIFNDYQNESMEDGEFFLRRIADYTVVTERNWKTNQRTAAFLSYSLYTLLSGILITAIFIIQTIL